jgi:predicted RNase H-like nuclease
MTWVAGVDGCRRGWFIILRNTNGGETRHDGPVAHISHIVEIPEKPSIVALDIPIGLLDHAQRGGRPCDQEARTILMQPRARSVFSPPVRSALRHLEYKSALEANRASSPDAVGISKQCFALFDKIRQVDEWISGETQSRIIEVHPELCFLKMKGDVSLSYSKKKRQGMNERFELLAKERFGEVIESAKRETLRRDVAEDDILDACAACWTASRILKNQACFVPKQSGGPRIWF